MPVLKMVCPVVLAFVVWPDKTGVAAVPVAVRIVHCWVFDSGLGGRREWESREWGGGGGFEAVIPYGGCR